ncbi:MAG: RidA family protein [Acidimicrobiia bacterium]|nr:RidA family protein [Acidimicrobiia bacterium]
MMGADRRSIDIKGLSHVNPIPVGTRIGPLLVSSVVAPFDPGTRTVPDTAEAQIANLFAHVGNILEAGGAGWGDVAKMTFFVSDIAFRDAINAPWAERFPDPASRPSRHTQLSPQASPKPMVTCDVIAYVGTPGDAGTGR